MTNYRNEAHFSKALLGYLKKHNWFVQRIESGTTGRGIPDVYAISPDGQAMWLELKRVHSVLKGKDRAVIPWRPGQQAWLRMVDKLKQTVYTIAAFDDCFLLIPHHCIWSNDVAIVSKCHKFWHFKDLVGA